jgi:hypothetical protein
MRHFLLGVALTVACIPQAEALRPFDGTDAAVAKLGTMEYEVGYLGLLRDGGTKYLFSPALVMNAGVAASSELVLEGRLRTRLAGTSDSSGTALQDAAVSLKHVYRPGVLQDAQGPSIASECGVLLPSEAGDHTGLACAGIVSQRVSGTTVHLNAALARNRERQWKRSFGVIIEGPRYGRLEPVFEGLVGANSDRVRTHSVLAGVIASMADNLTLDVGLRTGRVGGTRLSEIRAGLTWSPP